MCFSATASFTASGVLLAVAIPTLKKIQKKEYVPFGIIPLMFSVQQFSEGLLWMSLKAGTVLQDNLITGVHNVSMYVFLAFALCVWPVWIPLSTYMPEKDKLRKRMLGVLFIMGTVLATYLAYCTIAYPVSVTVLKYRIHYNLDFPYEGVVWHGVAYFIPTVIAPLLSTNKKIKLIGALILASLIVSEIFFRENVFSVWCFFAAVISVLVYLVVREKPVKVST